MAVRAGSTFRAAARSVGWSEDSFQRYRAKDAVFAAQVEEADGLAEVHLVAIVRQAAQTNWRAALELLGRRWPESWGRSADAQPALLATPMVVTVEFDRPDRPLMLDAS
jgi:malonyl CoA-acyl carrier protein transacylase